MNNWSEIFAGLLVIVGFLQVGVMILQWLIYRRQTHIQEANIAQWVDIESIGIQLLTKSKSDPPEKIGIMLRWKVLNNTFLPFTITKIETHVCRRKDWEVFEVEEITTIPPAKTGTHNFYPFFVELFLSKSETKKFLEDGVTLSVAICISYIDATGNSKIREFGDFYECSKDSMTISEGLGKTPTKRVEKDSSPSTIRRTPYRFLDVAEEEEDDKTNS